MLENHNTIKLSFNEDFCSHLEYHLSRAFLNSSEKTIKFLWCDGIKMPLEDQLGKANLIKTKTIVTQAWIGIDGQDLYEMVICFGDCAIKSCVADQPLMDCLPSDEMIDWLAINIERKTIDIQLH